MESRPARAKTPAQSRVQLHQLMLPGHANPYGNVHGGVVLKIIDEAGAIAAMRHAQRPCVTVAMDSVTFLSPVHLGEVIRCTAQVTYVGRTSLELEVDVVAEDPLTGRITHTNSAYLVYVALDDQGAPTEVPPLELDTDEARLRWQRAERRQQDRLAARRSPSV